MSEISDETRLLANHTAAVRLVIVMEQLRQINAVPAALKHPQAAKISEAVHVWHARLLKEIKPLRTD